MDKQKAIKTQEMWKDYENTRRWIDTISNPQKYLTFIDKDTVVKSPAYLQAEESLRYILLGETTPPFLVEHKD